MIYFTSDLHIGDNNIIIPERDRFNNIEEHNKFVMESINKQLREGDELWILGDIKNIKEFNKLRKWKNKTYLILGNHDFLSKEEYEPYFTKVYDHPVYFTKRILLSHFPQLCDEDVINIHGHLHNSGLALPNYINANIHLCMYKLLSLSEIEGILRTIPINVNKHKYTYEWWADKQFYIRNDFNYLNKNNTINIKKERERIELLNKLDINPKITTIKEFEKLKENNKKNK